MTPDDWSVGKPDFWDRPGDAKCLPRTYWYDPLDGVPGGVLLADAIGFYCAQFGMVRPFRWEYCGSATYVLTVGDLAAVDGELLHLSTSITQLEIPPRGHAVIVPAEVLVVPHYIAGRLGLTRGGVHQGLVLGIGAQVDPGYQGALSLVVHNLADRAVTLTRGQRVAQIEFVRTTALGSEDRPKLAKIPDGAEDRLYDEQRDLAGPGGYPPRLFPRERRWRHPVNDY